MADKNYGIMSIGTFGGDLVEKGRIMAGEQLGLTGCKISFNATPAGGFVPFVHAHKLNEEVYIILSGDGAFMVDGEEFAVKEGDVVRVDPAGERALKAGDTGMTYLCIQAQAGSLTQATMDDGVLCETKASWMA